MSRESFGVDVIIILGFWSNIDVSWVPFLCKSASRFHVRHHVQQRELPKSRMQDGYLISRSHNVGESGGKVESKSACHHRGCCATYLRWFDRIGLVQLKGHRFWLSTLRRYGEGGKTQGRFGTVGRSQREATGASIDLFLGIFTNHDSFLLIQHCAV